MYTEQEYIEVIKKYSQSYYEGHPLISDAEFDKIYDEFSKTYPKSKFLEQPAKGFDPDSTNLQKFPHQYGIVGSLAKIHSVEEFDMKGPYSASVKLDGSSLVVYYKDGYVTKALTRGNGVNGLDVTSKLDAIAPLHKKYVEVQGTPFTGAVRGEVVMSNYNFESYKELHPEAMMPRNVATGLLMRKDVSPDLKYIDYVTYKILADENFDASKSANIHCVRDILFQDFGFKVVESTTINKDEFTDEHMFDIRHTEEFDKYPCDGIVLTKSNITTTDGIFNYEEIAYKFAEETKETTVVDVEWNFSPKGKLVPVVVVEPITLSGARVSRVSGFNYKFIKDNQIGPGARITIMRSGAVIPDIQSVTRPGILKIPTECPSCHKPLELTETGVDLICTNDLTCEAKMFGTLYVFFETMGQDIKGLGEVMIEDLVDYIFAVYDKVYGEVPTVAQAVGYLRVLSDASITSFWKPATADKIMKLKKLLSEPWDKERFLCALNIPFVGQVASKLLATKGVFETLFTDRPVLSGVNPSVATKIINNSDRLKDFNNLTVSWKESAEITKFVAITGSISVGRKEFEQQLATKGIGLSDNFKKIECLITNDPNSGSSKNKKAKELGIKILTEAEFREAYSL